MATILDYTAYAALQTLARVRVPQLAPNQAITNTQTGTTTVGTSQAVVVEGIQGQTATSSQYVADGQYLFLTPPVDANGNTPDALVTITVGTTKYAALQLNATDQLVMFPAQEYLEGSEEYVVPLGQSTIRALQIGNDIAAGRVARQSLPANMPLVATGIKIPPDTVFSFTVISQAGWGQNGAAIRPLEIHLVGEVTSTSVVAAYAPGWDAIADFALSSPPFGAVSGHHSIPNALSGDTLGQAWAALPGGSGQTGPVSIQPYYVDAVNLNVISASSERTVYSEQASIGGAPGTVTLFSNPSVRNEADLGDTAKSSVFIWQRLGFAFDPSLIVSGANPQMYVGLRIANTTTIPGNGNGRLVSLRQNPFQWGRKYPQGTSGRKYVPMPFIRLFGDVLSIGGTSVAPQVSTQGLSDLAAQSVHVLKGGLVVTGPGVITTS